MTKVSNNTAATKSKKPKTENKESKQTQQKNEPKATKTQNETKTTQANNHDMKSTQLSDREKEMQTQLQNGEVEVKAGDKLGNAARAMADGDGNGELSETEKESLQSNAKAILDKNPELAALAKEKGLDVNNPEDLDAIMNLSLEDAKLPENKLKVPSTEEVQQAKEAIDENNEELPPPENVDAPHQGANCNTPHVPDVISQISKIIQEGYQALQGGDNNTAVQKFSQAISMGTEQLQKELQGGGQDKPAGAIVDPAKPEHLKQPGALKPAQQEAALNTLQQNDPNGTIKEAMSKAQENPRIQKLLDLVAYAQKGLEKAQGGNKDDVKKQTGGDPNAQQGILQLNNKPNVPNFKPLAA
jgi:hypothetical protein